MTGVRKDSVGSIGVHIEVKSSTGSLLNRGCEFPFGKDQIRRSANLTSA